VLIALRDAVRKELEGLRVAGAIGSSLQASVTISANASAYVALLPLADELRFWLQTSAVRVEPGVEFCLAVTASTDLKCDRCWHYQPDVGQHPGHETICGRCVSNIEGPGETRRWF